MFCKYCGNVISDPASAVCKKCGRPQKTDGGTGFWDILSQPPEAEKPARPEVRIAPEVPAAPPVRKAAPAESARRRKKSDVSLTAYALIALCLVAVCVLLGKSAAAERRVKKLEQDQAAISTELSRTLSRANELESFKAAMESYIAASESKKEDPAPAPQTLAIISQPSSEPNIKKDAEGTEKLIFSVETNIAPASFEWQKKGDDGVWRSLDLGSDGLDRQLGLKIQSSGTRSALYCASYIDGAQGTYRCVVTAADGTAQASREVSLAFASETDSEA